MLLNAYLDLNDAEKFELVEIPTNAEFRKLILKTIMETKDEICNLNPTGDPVSFMLLYASRKNKLDNLLDLQETIKQMYSDTIERQRNEPESTPI